MTPKEQALWNEFVLHRGEVLKRSHLRMLIETSAESNAIDVHIKNLRAKLAVTEKIESVRGIGYKLV